MQIEFPQQIKLQQILLKYGKKNIIGIEKSKANYSYIDAYKSFRISTVDNIDMIMGKVSLILAMEGRPGHYGIKATAENIIPNLKLSLVDYSKGGRQYEKWETIGGGASV